jgi:hypothetical protein
MQDAAGRKDRRDSRGSGGPFIALHKAWAVAPTTPPHVALVWSLFKPREGGQ